MRDFYPFHRFLHSLKRVNLFLEKDKYHPPTKNTRFFSLEFKVFINSRFGRFSRFCRFYIFWQPVEI